jgi:uncharacterized iron-regulated protein
MNIRRIAAFVWGLVVIVASNTMINVSAMPTAAAELIGQHLIELTTAQQQTITQLQTAKIIYLGETHDRESDHQQQLVIIQALFKHNPRLAIGLEMFQRAAQPLLDRYLTGEITAAQLQVQSEFDKRWGYQWEFYLPILEFARANHLRLIALNTPTEITRKVGKQGLESLTSTELQFIPPIAEIDRSNVKYRQMILASYQQHAGIVSIASKSFDRFYTAQLLWDETMAERIAKFANQNPSYQTIVLAGSSHIVYGYGIPDRVRRRSIDPKLSQITVLLNSEGFDLQAQPQPTDLIWDRLPAHN